MITLLIATFISTSLVIMVSGGDYFHRYTYPFLLAASLILFIVALEYARKTQKKLMIAFCFIIALLSCSLSEKFNFHFREIQHFFALNPPKFYDLLNRKIDPSISILNEPLWDTNNFKYKKLISSAPENANILIYLKHPYNLDLSSERFVILDTPYAMQPFGRMPETNADSLASYFRRGGLDYMAVSRIEEFTIDKANKIIQEYNNREHYRWNSTMIMYEALFRKFILEIADNNNVVYDDGENMLIDLTQHK